MKKSIVFFEYHQDSPTVYLPHVYGVLRLYSESHEKVIANYQWLSPQTTYPVQIDAFKNEKGQNLVFAFSVYVWNRERCLRSMNELRRKYPEALFIAGGPSISKECAQEFLVSESGEKLCDVTVLQEGEATLVNILIENLESRDWSKVPGVAYMKDSNEFVLTMASDRLDLSLEKSSPYGVYHEIYDEIVKSLKKQKLKVGAIIETNRGCPYMCGFCNWGSLTGNKIYQYGMKKIEEDFKSLAKLELDHIMIADANFGILPRDKEISKSLNQNFKKQGIDLSINFTKSFNPKVVETYKVLNEGMWKSTNPLNISVQSLNPKSLEAIQRANIGLENFLKSLDLIKEDFDSFTSDLIVGLPFSTLQDHLHDTLYLLRKGFRQINIFSLLIIPNTDINTNLQKAEWGLKIKREPVGGSDRVYCDSKGEEFQECVDVVYETAHMKESEIRLATCLSAFMDFSFDFMTKLIPRNIVESDQNYIQFNRSVYECFLELDKYSKEFLTEKQKINELWHRYYGYLRHNQNKLIPHLKRALKLELAKVVST